MKKRIIVKMLKVLCGISLTIGLPITYSSEPHQQIVSLDDIKKYAIQNNFKIKSLRQRVEEVKSKISKSKSVFYPKIGIAAGVDNKGLENERRTDQIGHIYGNVNLFNGLKDVLGVERNKKELVKAEIELKNEEFRIGQEVEQEFYNYLLKKDLIELKLKMQGKNESHSRLVTQARSKGLASMTDVMEFELKSVLLLSELTGLKQDLEEVRLSLKKLLGEEIGLGISPVGKIPHQHISGDLNSYVKEVHKTNPVILSSLNELSQVQIDSKIVRNEWWPKVDFEIKSGYLEDRDLDKNKDKPETVFLLMAKMELFSGFETLWGQREKAAEMNKISFNLKNHILSTVAQVETSYRRLKAIEERADLEKRNEEASQKYYDSVLNEYRRGFKNSSDLNNASEKIFDVAQRRVNYLHQSLMERIQLEIALGRKVDVQDM